MSELFTSAEQMQKATNYNQWTFDLFKKYIHGDILEVGCGVGSFTKLITDQSDFDSMYCIDISSAAIDHIKKRNFSKEIKIECLDLMDAEGEYDFIVCMNVMEHVKDDVNFFKKLLELLKPGGVLFHLVPSHQFLYSKFDEAAGHFKRYDKNMMRSFDTGENVKLIDQYYFNLIGALGYWAVYKILKSGDINDTEGEIGMFDKYIVPFSRNFLPLKTPIGISLISVYKKN
ncbi:MAG: class I SAM-dependent methyltransferase [Ignavibacteriae bacterium]|nr:class I SAM-dependent methyltransferase [Ignavibacteriota bacterium]